MIDSATGSTASQRSLLRNALPISSLNRREISPFRQMSTQSSERQNGDSPAHFSYHIAASFTAKDQPYDPSTHIFHFNIYNRIHQAKESKQSRPNSGHDAFFVSRVGESGAVGLGVADGVGGWVDSGIDPADFSHRFCHYMAATAYEDKSEHGRKFLTARQLMQKGYDAVCADKTLKAGGSTACVAVASPDGELDVANLGDSGFMQLRPNAVHAHSEPQTHAFNTPFQLSLIPPMVAARMAVFGGAQLSDLPRDADVTSHSLRHGDVLIFASDGLWDNLFNQDILRIVSRVMIGSGAWIMTDTGGIRVADSLAPPIKPTRNGPSTQEPAHASLLQSVLATEIVGAAKAASINTNVDGPFAKAVRKYFPQENWRGGKVDDICVIVAVVFEERLAGDIKSRL